MSISGYINIPEIPGESLVVVDEKNIDVLGVEWEVASVSSAMTGSGRSRARPAISEMSFFKMMDAASPELALAAMRGDAFDEIKFTAVKASGAELLKFLTITLSKCMISRYKMMPDNPDMFNNERNVIAEKISIVFEKIDYLYVVQADDHSQGEERQIEYDIPAGV